MARSSDPELRRWWSQLLQSFDPQRSTVAEFCRRHQVSAASFYQWRRKLQGQLDRDRNAHAFLPVQLVAHGPPATVVVHLPHDVRVEIPVAQQELLLNVVDHLRRRPEETKS